MLSIFIMNMGRCFIAVIGNWASHKKYSQDYVNDCNIIMAS